MARSLLLALLIAATPATAQTTSPDPVRLRATVQKLVSFGTRHTLSSATDPLRGIGAARAWAAEEFRRLGLVVERPQRSFTGPRAPNGVMIEDVLGIQPGSSPGEVVIVASHIDSRVTDVMDSTSDAPGANDDGSGVALVLEAARILSRQHHRATIVYAALSGEEQGLWGGTLLAETAKARGWRVTAMLNNDIVGNTVGTDDRSVVDRVRVFSEGIGLAQDLPALRTVRQIGGEDDSPSRALAKRIGVLANDAAGVGMERTGPDSMRPRRRVPGMITAMLVRRPDRFGRGGDHTPLLEAGFPAVRFTSGIENYDAQHQNLRSEAGRVFGDTIDRMDFSYLAKVTALNVATLRALADAPPAPRRVALDGALSLDTKVSWTAVEGALGYRIRWRRADTSDWDRAQDVPASATSTILNGIIVDDDFIGVSALGPNGTESLVTFGGLKLE